MEIIFLKSCLYCSLVNYAIITLKLGFIYHCVNWFDMSHRFLTQYIRESPWQNKFETKRSLLVNDPSGRPLHETQSSILSWVKEAAKALMLQLFLAHLLFSTIQTNFKQQYWHLYDDFHWIDKTTELQLSCNYIFKRGCFVLSCFERKVNTAFIKIQNGSMHPIVLSEGHFSIWIFKIFNHGVFTLLTPPFLIQEELCIQQHCEQNKMHVLLQLKNGN